MIDDPIVEEVRKHRRARAAKFNFNVEAIAADAIKRERAAGRKIIRPGQNKSASRTARIRAATAD